MSDAGHLSEQLKLARESTVSEFSKLMPTLPTPKFPCPDVALPRLAAAQSLILRQPLKQKHSTPQSLALPDFSHIRSIPPDL